MYSFTKLIHAGPIHHVAQSVQKKERQWMEDRIQKALSLIPFGTGEVMSRHITGTVSPISHKGQSYRQALPVFAASQPFTHSVYRSSSSNSMWKRFVPDLVSVRHHNHTSTPVTHSLYFVTRCGGRRDDDEKRDVQSFSASGRGNNLNKT